MTESCDDGAYVDGVLAACSEADQAHAKPVRRRVHERYQEPLTGKLLPSRDERTGRVSGKPPGGEVELPGPPDEDDDS